MDLSRPYTVICPSLEGPVLDVLAHTTRPLTGREIARLASRGSERGVRLVLHRLVANGLVSAQEAGSASLFALNREHVAAGIVEGLMRLRTELIERIRREIEGWPSQPVHVSIFGSTARADGHMESDIDLLIVRPEDLAEDDPQWREQLHRLAERIERWS
ncbi:MAG: nucleotidyltransferase domain-containing protein, partial [Solirubrobacteraceae bacterium]